MEQKMVTMKDDLERVRNEVMCAVSDYAFGYAMNRAAAVRASCLNEYCGSTV